MSRTLTDSKLRRWRIAEGLSLAEVAGLTGISVPMLSRVERGERQMSARAKITFARRLGLPVAELFDVEPIDIDEAVAG